MVFGKIKEVNGHKYCYVIKSIRKGKEYPEEKVVKYFGKNFEGFYNYLEKYGLFQGAIVDKLSNYFTNLT